MRHSPLPCCTLPAPHTHSPVASERSALGATNSLTHPPFSTRIARDTHPSGQDSVLRSPSRWNTNRSQSRSWCSLPADIPTHTTRSPTHGYALRCFALGTVLRSQQHLEKQHAASLYALFPGRSVEASSTHLPAHSVSISPRTASFLPHFVPIYAPCETFTRERGKPIDMVL